MILLDNFSIEIIEFIQPSSTWKVEVEGVEDATASASTLSTRGVELGLSVQLEPDPTPPGPRRERISSKQDDIQSLLVP